MKFAVEEINNSTSLLPNVTLGYEIFDVCYKYNNIHPALDFLSRDRLINIQRSYINYIPKVIAVIGPDSSDAAIITGNIFNLFLIPQINYYAISSELSNLKLPSCFQTVPNHKKQKHVIVDILLRFNWTWIAILGSEDDYGQEGLLQLYDAASPEGICVAYQGLIPVKVAGREKEWNKEVSKIVENIAMSKVNVIVVFALDIIAIDFFQAVVDRDLPGKVWIASETWSVAKSIYSLPNSHRLGVVVGIAMKNVEIPGFTEYLVHLVNHSTVEPMKVAKENCNQNCDSCLKVTLSELLGPPERRVIFNVYSAVYAVAYALHEVLGCNHTHCNMRMVYPWQVTNSLKQVNFSLLNNSLNFDQYGDSQAGFDIVFWNWTGRRPFVKVGSYSNVGSLRIQPELITWHTENNTVPPSVCSKKCLFGQEMKPKGSHKCCFICADCAKGTFLNEDGICTNCGADQWSPERSITCFNKTRIILDWNGNAAIVLITVTLVGMLLTLVIVVAFAHQIQSPVVKAAGGKMCFFMLAALGLAFLCTFSFIGEPSSIKCILRHPTINTALTVCFSYIAVKSFQIVCIFKMAAKLPKTYDYWVKKNGQYVCVVLLTSIQLFISCLWVFWKPPGVSTTNLDQDKLLLECNEASSVMNILEFAYNSLLSLLCFTFSYVGKGIPKNYSEAKCITFAMLIYFMVCISFFTANLIDVGHYITTINAMLALVSLFGIMGGYFFPKCYVILWRPEFNTTQYFQTAIQAYTRRKSTMSSR
ncbi:taste receptor type 1 member 2-like [Microcaecilia unicolor]|uniref:Taste receptor type 1 member 2 n=1 Tax=Microcaecilia unicolor TaxID=1415580 RepID=A0A6P7WTQ3_9AMPH|nr:taste receptor type 1 member 2-like [Microcaecilia unicolor]